MTFGEKLKKCRKSHGITQTELGKELNLTESTISLYESNKRFPDQKTLLKISKRLDISIDYLLGNHNAVHPSEKNYIVGDKLKPRIDPQYKTFGERIKALREYNGMSQEELAEKLNCSTATIQYFEDNYIPPDPAVTTLAKFFHVSKSYILGQTDLDDEPAYYITQNHPDKEIAELLKNNGKEKLILTKDITVQELKNAIAFIKSIKKPY